MTDIVNLDTLKQAIMELERQKLEKNIREYFCYQADPEQVKIWVRYMELERERERKEKIDKRIAKITFIGLWLLAAYCFYEAYSH